VVVRKPPRVLIKNFVCAAATSMFNNVLSGSETLGIAHHQTAYLQLSKQDEVVYALISNALAACSEEDKVFPENFLTNYYYLSPPPSTSCLMSNKIYLCLSGRAKHLCFILCVL